MHCPSCSAEVSDVSRFCSRCGAATVELDGANFAVAEAIESGHKFALGEIAAGGTVHKFGWPIGRTTAPVAAGGHVHTHNVQTLLSGVEGYRFEKLTDTAPLPSAARPVGVALPVCMTRGMSAASCTFMSKSIMFTRICT